jgi:hypothetical protein
MAVEKDTTARAIGRYVLFREVAHGGMATVHLGRLRGPAGFARTVAIKRLHPQYARDPEFVSMFLDEARLAARVQHPNVVSVLDIVAAEGELFLVMDYVHGESFGRLQQLARDARMPIAPRIVAAIMSNVLDGLHAAHEARNERGDPLQIVHRDVSPQNVLVGADGVARVLDFGIAKAAERAHGTTRDGQMKGKVPYMAPEQIGQGQIDRRTDVYAASVILWEALAGQRLFPPTDVVQLVQMIMNRAHPPPSSLNHAVTPELDAVVMKGLAPDPSKRWASAHEMAVALERGCPPSSTREVGEWMRHFAEALLGERAKSIAEIENTVLPAVSSSKIAVGAVRARTARIVGRGTGIGRESTAGGMHEESTVTATASAGHRATDSQSPPPITGSTGMPAGVPPRWRTRGLVIGAAGGFVLALLSALTLSSGGACNGAKTAAPAAAAMHAPEPPVPPPTAPAAGDPPSGASANVAAVAPAAEGTPGEPVATPRPAVHAPIRRSSPPVSRTPARSDCNPPYTVDANGVRIPKRQCL